MRPKDFINYGFHTSPELLAIYSNLIEQSNVDVKINRLFMSFLSVVNDFDLLRFNGRLTQLADAIGWDATQRSLINNLLVKYGLEGIL